MLFHRIIASITLLIYIHILLNSNANCAPFAATCITLGNSGKGNGLAYALPLLSMVCLTFPEFMSYKFSPRFGWMNERLCNAKFYIVCGYLGLFLSYYLLKLF